MTGSVEQQWIVSATDGNWYGFYFDKEEATEGKVRMQKRGDSAGVKRPGLKAKYVNVWTAPDGKVTFTDVE